MLNQLIDKSALTGQYLSPGLCHVEISDAVDLGKSLCLSRARRPFHLELVAGKPVQIEIGFHREGVDHFPALLTKWLQRRERTCGCKASFLGEFAFCARQQVARFDIA